MRKIIVLLLSLTLVLTTFTACGSDKTKLDMDATITKQKLFADKNVKLTLKDQSFKSGVVTVTVQNKTNNLLKVGCLGSLVNGISVDNTRADGEILANKTTNITVSFDKKELKKNKIGIVSNIRIKLMFVNDAYEKVCETGYLGFDTDRNYDQELKLEGEAVFEYKDFRLNFLYREASEDKSELNQYMQCLNPTGKTYILNIANVEIKGEKLDATFKYLTIPPHSLTNINLLVSKQQLAEYSITDASTLDIATAEVTLYNAKTYKKLNQATIELK